MYKYRTKFEWESYIAELISRIPTNEMPSCLLFDESELRQMRDLIWVHATGTIWLKEKKTYLIETDYRDRIKQLEDRIKELESKIKY